MVDDLMIQCILIYHLVKCKSTSSYMGRVPTCKSTSSYMGSLMNCEIIFNITKRCSLCLHEKLAIITYPYPDELLNRRSELVTKCRHENKFLLKNFNSNDWSFEPYDNLRKWNINDVPNGSILLEFNAWVIQQEQNKEYRL